MKAFDRETIHIGLAGCNMVADWYTPSTAVSPIPVVLLHGWGAASCYWAPVISRLRDTFTLIVPDLPGVGRSQPVTHAFGMADLTQALMKLFDERGVTQVQFVGHSMGGGIGLLLAAHRPDLVERLVLTSISLFRNDRERRVFQIALAIAGITMKFRFPWMIRNQWLLRQSAKRFCYRVPQDLQLMQQVFRDYIQMDYATAMASARDSSTHVVNNAAHQVDLPTLLVVTHEDRIMPPQNVDYTAATIKQSQVVWIDECGHLPMVEKTDQYVSVLREFLLKPFTQDPALLHM